MDWTVIISEVVIPLVVTVVTPILLMLVKRAVDAFQAKTNLEVSKEQRELLEKLIGRGIAFAEEKARQALKADSTVMVGDDKLSLAIDFVKKNAAEAGIELKAEDLAELIEAKLFESRPVATPIANEDAPVLSGDATAGE